jgi:hypothetical protein
LAFVYAWLVAQNSRAGRNCVADSEPRNGLDWACREVAKRAGEVAADEIKRLESALKYREEENATLRRCNGDVDLFISFFDCF